MPYDTQTLITYRIQRAKETIDEVQMALERDHLHLAENRIYYGLFYIVQALALKWGITTSKHAQLLGWFNKEFIHTGRIDMVLGKTFQTGFEKRQEGDYDDFVTFSRDEVKKDFANMRHFLDVVEKMILEQEVLVTTSERV